MKRLNTSGQTLVALLIFVMLGILITTAAVAATVANTQANTALSAGEIALSNAESGVENALIVLERNPGYTGTINLTTQLSYGTATISVSGTTTKTITSTGVNGNFRRTVVATATYSTNVWTLASWSETP